ncbi:unnamed protein product [Ectocarpus sp. 12 AP-2014]
MAAARGSRRELTDDVQGSSGGSGAEAAASPVEDAVAANVLEHYIRFRSKAEDASFKGWLELLELTMPKLQCRRGLREIDKATRLCYVMMLVGTGRDPPLASRAIAAMLVDHWCDKGPCAFLQKDAIRHATVVDGEYSEGLDKESIAQQLESGVEDALDGTGLEGLGVFADWRRDRDVLCPGGAASLREEIMDVAQRCRDASNDLDALSILEDYTEERRMGTFEDDFMAWGRVQLEKLPATLFDRAGFTTSAPPSTPDAKKSSSAEGGGSAASSSRVDGSSGRRRRDKSTSVRDRSRAARRIITTISDSSSEDDSGSRRRGGVGIKPPSSAPPGSPRVSPSTSRKALGADDHGSGSKATAGSGASVAVSGSREQPLSLDDDGSGDDASSSGNGPPPASGGEPDSARERKDGHGRGGDPPCSSASDGSDDDELEDEYFPSDSSKRLRSERKKQRRKRRKKRHLDSGGVVPAAASLEEEAAKAVAAMEAARARPRRGGKRNQGELVEGDQVILEGKEFGRPTNWVPGVVTCNRKDGTYDVFLAGGEVARLVRRVELHYRHGGGAKAGARSSTEARPDGCPAAVFGSADVIDVSPGPGAEEAGGGEAGGGAGAGAGRRDPGRPRLSKAYRRVGGKVDAARPSDDEGVREEQEEEEEEGEEDEEEQEEEEEEEEDHTGDTRRAARVSAHAGSGGGGGGGSGRSRRRTRTMTNNTESGDDSDNGESRGSTREAEERKKKAAAPPAARGGASGGDGNSKDKGKGPARLSNTDRRTRVSVVDLAGDSPAASPTRAASATTAGLRAVRTRSPVRSSVSQPSRPASGRFFYYESVSEDDDDSSGSGDERRPVRSDASVKPPPARLNSGGGGGGGGGGRREKMSEVAQAVGWQANTASGNDGDNDGVTSSPAASSGGERHGERGRVSGAGVRDKAAAGKFPTDSEIAAHKEGGTGWGGDCASDSDGSSSSGSDAAAPRSRRPKRKGKARS